MAKSGIGVEAWEAFLRAHAAVVEVVAADVEAETGLPLSWYDVLLELRRAGRSGLRMSALGERVVLSRSRVSRIVDSMSQAGLVEKVADPEDGRATLARMTREGAGALRRTAPIYLESIDRHFNSRYDSSEVQEIRDLLSRLSVTN